MPTTKSILRYPGGKTQLSKFIKHTIELNKIVHPVYCEPFCGGSGIALNLLLSGTVESIILNDFDPAIYSIWNAAIHEPDRFIDKIKSTPVTIDEWHKQNSIYKERRVDSRYSFELAFAAFFLNRTNRSGIITGGPIGGFSQSSKYRLDCRFNPSALIQKIEEIAKYSEHIYLYSKDGIRFIRDVIPSYSGSNLFIYFDPPYYKQGQYLYKNGLSDEYHQKLSAAIQDLTDYKWITTYDDVPRIRGLYSRSNGFTYNLQYTANRKRMERELLFVGNTQIESFDKVNLFPI